MELGTCKPEHGSPDIHAIIFKQKPPCATTSRWYKVYTHHHADKQTHHRMHVCTCMLVHITALDSSSFFACKILLAPGQRRGWLRIAHGKWIAFQTQLRQEVRS